MRRNFPKETRFDEVTNGKINRVKNFSITAFEGAFYQTPYEDLNSCVWLSVAYRGVPKPLRPFLNSEIHLPVLAAAIDQG